MPKLYFRYGTVNSAKTMNLLCVAHNYESQNKRVLILKPAIDTRFMNVKSRTGLEKEAVIVKDVQDIEKLECKNYDCVLVDECQFFTSAQIDALKVITAHCPVICYGLKTDFKRNLFEGSKRLLEISETIEEIKNTCAYCNRKAIYNLRHSNGKKIKEGEQIELGLEDKYLPVCYEHY